ncbi:DUF3097 family protein [Brevibacterium sp. BRM-1]|uniref:DUF3097 family protein n=1 Tax=Brevibacterium sp. BRM-1 TaxID=2999062 RepID=UPI00227DA9C7|nr:DUF3097 family protein [Brevibacterium sp. BRM-1]WAL40949.1 DUF3097 family protein [Brevibacterium sp. BRM-1]
MVFRDPYGSDVLSSGPRTLRRAPVPKRPAAPGLVVEVVEGGYVGAVTKVEKTSAGFSVWLEDRAGRVRPFPLGHGFLLDGRPVELTRPERAATPGPRAPGRTASGSIAVPEARARTAIGSRIWVEGKHDAELVERIWGDDLRIEGVVVEPLGGLDLLGEKLAEFRPDPAHRVGVLADHIVAGSKETRIARDILARREYRGVVHIIGHPYIDIWQAVRPAVVGIAAWPDVPRGEDWKLGVLKRIGWPHADHRDAARAWATILGRVRRMADVEPALAGRVEELIDFVTVDGGPQG